VTTATLTDFDVYLWSEGSHYRAYEKLGAHVGQRDGIPGTHFAVWAPDAAEVSVIGDFNGWQPGVHPMRPVRSSGIWDCFIPGVGKGALYKFTLTSRYHGYRVEKADPFGFAAEIRPRTASKV
jgi:1,4-alpha-glucan branching enzyme